MTGSNVGSDNTDTPAIYAEYQSFSRKSWNLRYPWDIMLFSKICGGKLKAVARFNHRVSVSMAMKSTLVLQRCFERFVGSSYI